MVIPIPARSDLFQQHKTQIHQQPWNFRDSTLKNGVVLQHFC